MYPWILCCTGLFKDCGRYTFRRPVDDCSEWPERPPPGITLHTYKTSQIYINTPIHTVYIHAILVRELHNFCVCPLHNIMHQYNIAIFMSSIIVLYAINDNYYSSDVW